MITSIKHQKSSIRDTSGRRMGPRSESLSNSDVSSLNMRSIASNSGRLEQMAAQETVIQRCGPESPEAAEPEPIMQVAGGVLLRTSDTTYVVQIGEQIIKPVMVFKNILFFAIGSNFIQVALEEVLYWTTAEEYSVKNELAFFLNCPTPCILDWRNKEYFKILNQVNLPVVLATSANRTILFDMNGEECFSSPYSHSMLFARSPFAIFQSDLSYLVCDASTDISILPNKFPKTDKSEYHALVVQGVRLIVSFNNALLYERSSDSVDLIGRTRSRDTSLLVFTLVGSGDNLTNPDEILLYNELLDEVYLYNDILFPETEEGSGPEALIYCSSKRTIRVLPDYTAAFDWYDRLEQMGVEDYFERDRELNEYLNAQWMYQPGNAVVFPVPAPIIDRKEGIPDESFEVQVTKLITNLVALVSVSGDGLISADTAEITQILIGDQDRPETRFDLQKSHTVAWTLIRAAIMGFSGQKIEVLLRWLRDGFSILNSFLDSKEGRIILSYTQVSTPDGKMGTDVIDSLLLPGTVLPAETWGIICSRLLIIYLQAYQLSRISVYNHQPKGRGEGTAMTKLRAKEELLRANPDYELTIKEKTDMRAWMEALLDVQFNIKCLGVWEYAAAILEWENMLVLAYPAIMSKDRDFYMDRVKQRKLAPSFYTQAPGLTGGRFPKLLWTDAAAPCVGDLVAAFIAENESAEYREPVEALPVESPLESIDYGELASSFLAQVLLQPIEEEMDEYKAEELFISLVRISDRDRAKTKFLKQQESHTVAWTLTRAALCGFKGMRLITLLVFLRVSIHELEQELSPEKKGILGHAIDQGMSMMADMLNEPHPIEEMIEAISQLVKLYVVISQAAASASFHNPNTARAEGHGEARKMALLRKNEATLEISNLDHTFHTEEEIVEAAVGLFDVVITDSFSMELAQKARFDLMRKLKLAFPNIVKVFGPQIAQASQMKIFSQVS